MAVGGVAAEAGNAAGGMRLGQTVSRKSTTGALLQPANPMTPHAASRFMPDPPVPSRAITAAVRFGKTSPQPSVF
jgi:hypothetical protein